MRGLDALTEELLGTFRVPKHPFASLQFGLKAIRSAEHLAKSTFRSEKARGLFAGLAAHSVLPLEARGSAAFGLVMAALAHRHGWPVIAGGAQHLTDALAACLESLGGLSRPGMR